MAAYRYKDESERDETSTVEQLASESELEKFATNFIDLSCLDESERDETSTVEELASESELEKSAINCLDLFPFIIGAFESEE